MRTTMNITKDDETTYLTLPEKQPELSAEQQEKNLVQSYIDQLTSLWLAPNTNEDNARKIKIAHELVAVSRMLTHSAAYTLLQKAAKHTIFADTEALSILHEGLSDEFFKRSPLLSSDISLAFIEEKKKTHPELIADFLRTPDFLLLWANRAPAIETAKLVQKYFIRHSDDYDVIRSLADEEYQLGKPGKALLFYTLICPGRLTEEGQRYVRYALTQLYNHAPSEKYERVILSLRPCVKATPEYIAAANNCYLNLNKLNLPAGTVLKDMPEYPGAQLSQSTLTNVSLLHVNLTQADLTHAKLTGSALTGAILTGANLTNANLENAALDDADLTGADLRGANLKGANLQGATLNGTLMDDETDLTDTQHLQRNNVADLPIHTNAKEFNDELNRLDKVVNSHANSDKLRTAIVSDVINYAYSKSISRTDAVGILKTLANHALCAGVAILKGLYNLGVGAFSLLKRTTPEARYETKWQKQVREALIDVEGGNKDVTNITPATARPAMPAISPPPPKPEFAPKTPK